MRCPLCKEPGLKVTDRTCPKGHKWIAPQPGPQTRFMSSTAHELLYGGAAGGGKSFGLAASPLRWAADPNFSALILRRETTQLKALIKETRKVYPVAFPDARDVQAGGGLEWRFASGATVLMTHCKDEKDAFDYQGQEFQFIGIDELTHFLWTQYQELKSRVRSPHPGLPRYLRCTSNPGGDGHEWVFTRWGAWLDPDFEAPGLAIRFDDDGPRVPPLRSGEVAWLVRDGEGERYIPRPTVVDPEVHTSRSFIAATVEDNPILLQNDPGYRRSLDDLDPVRRAQLKGGNWLIKPAKGLFFKRGWFQFVDAAPAKGYVVRYWDRAGTVEDRSDYTVGLKMLLLDDEFWVLDVVRFKGTPGEVEKTIKATAELDGKGVTQVLELDPGQAGLSEMHQYAKLLQGFPMQPFRPTGDKVVRAQIASAQVEASNVKLLRAPWNEALIQECEGFPEWAHDDQVDTLSGAVTVLCRMGGTNGKKRTTTPNVPKPDLPT